jgi:hypothetical protein
VLSLNRRRDPEVTAQQQYALLMVSEEQLNQLIRQQAMRQVNRRPVPRLPPAYQPSRRAGVRVAGVAAVLVALIAAAGAWLWTPRTALAGMLPSHWSVFQRSAPPLVTGASFSVVAASARSADAAGVAMGRLQGMGLPAFASMRQDAGRSTPSYQVLVGPYVSLDEAEGMLRRLSTAGFSSARLSVDASLRHATRDPLPVTVMSDMPAVVLVGAPGRLALALELPNAPRRVTSRRVSDNLVEVEAGPIATRVQARTWSAPDGVHLIESVSIGGSSSADAPSGVGQADPDAFLRAQLSVPAFVRSDVRVEGRRVYVDLTWPSVAGEILPLTRQSTSAPMAVQDTRPSPPEAPRASIEPLLAGIDRFEEVVPFLLSAPTASPEVLGALDQTVAALERALEAMRVPSEAAAGHGILITAARAARRGLDPAFRGDRLAQMHQAVGLFESGKSQVMRDPRPE